MNPESNLDFRKQINRWWNTFMQNKFTNDTALQKSKIPNIGCDMEAIMWAAQFVLVHQYVYLAAQYSGRKKSL